jgi:hypothetical protein
MSVDLKTTVVLVALGASLATGGKPMIRAAAKGVKKAAVFVVHPHKAKPPWYLGAKR